MQFEVVEMMHGAQTEGKVVPGRNFVSLEDDL